MTDTASGWAETSDGPEPFSVDSLVALYRAIAANDRYTMTPLEARQAEIMRLEADWLTSPE